MKTLKLSPLDKGILQAIALFSEREFRKRQIETGLPGRTYAWHVGKLKRESYLLDCNTLTEKGKAIVVDLQNLRHDESKLISAHAFQFKATIFHKPVDFADPVDGWITMRFHRNLEQIGRISHKVRYRIMGETLILFLLEDVFGRDPALASLEAAKIADEAVEKLRSEGWRIADPIQDKPAHFVFEFLGPFAKAIYRQTHGVSCLDVLVDNSKRDGGEIEVIGLENAEALFYAIANLPRFVETISERMAALEREKKV